jgi:hypothetical protein
VTRRPRRQLLLLVALVIIGTALVVWRMPSTSVGDAGTAVRAGGSGEAPRAGSAVGDIRLESLEHREDEDSTPSRDVFRFGARREASAAVASSRPVDPAPVDTVPPAPTGPPPPPPIPLRYIGYLGQAGEVPRVAVLSDGRGNVFNGKEGDIIEGRYRVLRVGTDSADLIYVDGRGRQTIRLSGQ